MALADRLRKVEKRIRLPGIGRRWIRIIWHPGQHWAAALAASSFRPGDAAIVRRVVDAADGLPVPDPVHEADRAAMRAFFTEPMERTDV